MRQEPFSLEQPSIEAIGERLGRLYSGVSLSRDPMFAWVQITNDVTILAEELRRSRDDEATERAANVLWRLLEFIGYYAYVHKPGPTFAGTVARLLRQASHDDIMPEGPREGPTRWILAKYPFACSKCGQAICHCLVEPWVLENRREDPDGYFAKFLSKAEEARRTLRTKQLTEFTLRAMLYHFSAIYRSSYYHQDPWKIGMHLAEEVGEATTELSRLDLGWRARRASFDLSRRLTRTFEIAEDALERDMKGIKNKRAAKKYDARIKADMPKVKKAVRKDPWGAYNNMVRHFFVDSSDHLEARSQL